MDRNAKIMFYGLIASSIVFFISLFSMSYKVMGLGVLQFAFTVFGSLFFNLNRRKIGLSDFVNYNDARSTELFHQKKYVGSVVYLSALPMIIVGMITITTMIIAAIFFV